MKFVLFIIIIFTEACAYPSGMSVIGESVFENLKIGRMHKLSEIKKDFFEIKNLTGKAMAVKVYVEQTEEKRLKKNCSSLPDISWIHVENPVLSIAAGSKRVAKFSVKIPEKKKYAGKRYQFSVIAETLADERTEGIVYGIALKSRVIFSTIK